jgi:Uma2 family endonuclease
VAGGNETIMKMWLRRIRGAIGMGFTWALAWFIAGMVPRWVLGINADVPFPLVFGVLGFLAGVTFSGVILVTERRRSFDQISIPRFAAWGALGGLLLSAVFSRMASLGWADVMMIAPTFALSSALCASGSLAIARRAMRQDRLDSPVNNADVELTDDGKRSLPVRLHALQPRTYPVAMPAARSDWTVEMLDALPDHGDRHEVIDGELFVTPAPSYVHQLVVLALAARLRDYLRPSQIGRPLVSPSDVWRGDRRRNRVQPDVFVVRLTNGEPPAYPFELPDLLLAVEVVSPTSSAYDYQTKRELYLRSGIPEYWIIDPDARTFVRWRNAEDPGELLTAQVEWHPGGMAASIVIGIHAFFEDALG